MLRESSTPWREGDKRSHKGLPLKSIMHQLYWMSLNIFITVILSLVVTFFPGTPIFAAGKLGNVGTFKKWSKVEVMLQGPKSIGTSTSPNPFKQIVTVGFVAPNGQTYEVPAFYDGDGNGDINGTVWKARFSPDVLGIWTFSSMSEDASLDNYQGSFKVEPVEEGAHYFAKWGRLEYVGDHYLKFRDGSYWLKGGADEPESFLGPDVMGNWQDKKSIVDYLNSKGVNSLYIMLQNVDGDGKNVWPWLSPKDSEHFDIVKLAEWEDLFCYLQAKGIVLHLVFEDDSGWTGFNRVMYYREMIARFAHHNGLYWNISEEYGENYSANQIKSFAALIRDLDPYDHPLTVHNVGSLDAWNPFLGDDRFDLTSFQTNSNPQNQSTIEWRAKSRSAGRRLAVSHDETGQFRERDRDKSRHMVWAVYLGGGMIELFTRDVAKKGFQVFEDFWNDMGHAREFLEALPFWEMAPNNQLLLGGTGNRYCFARVGDVYGGYLQNGGMVSLDLREHPGIYEVKWYEVKTGKFSDGFTISGDAVVALGRPAFSGDVAVLVQRKHSSRAGR